MPIWAASGVFWVSKVFLPGLLFKLECKPFFLPPKYHNILQIALTARTTLVLSYHFLFYFIRTFVNVRSMTNHKMDYFLDRWPLTNLLFGSLTEVANSVQVCLRSLAFFEGNVWIHLWCPTCIMRTSPSELSRTAATMYVTDFLMTGLNSDGAEGWMPLESEASFWSWREKSQNSWSSS